jgi:hypothetical protein
LAGEAVRGLIRFVVGVGVAVFHSRTTVMPNPTTPQPHNPSTLQPFNPSTLQLSFTPCHTPINLSACRAAA